MESIFVGERLSRRKVSDECIYNTHSWHVESTVLLQRRGADPARERKGNTRFNYFM